MNKIIAKLLSRENIEVIEGNFSTASFDVKNRVLRVPSWSFESKDMYDLFISHEVGHALFTTVEGIHEAKEIIPGVPFSYVNVVEDCRIEKLIRREFPGLVPVFTRAYKELLAREFFGADIENVVNDRALIDKINIKSKCGAHVNVEFNPEEQVLFDQCMAAETWQDVIEAIQAIIEYEKLNKPKQRKNQDSEQTQPKGSNDGGNNNGAESPESLIEIQDLDEQDADDQQDAENDSNKGNEDNKDEEAEEQDLPEAQTDVEYRKNEEKAIEEAMNKALLLRVNKESAKKSIYYYKDLESHRAEYSGELKYRVKRDDFKEYMKEVKRTIIPAVNAFNMKKSAYENARASSSKSGTIDEKMLWSYKVNDDIFARVTALPNAKNHGFFFLLDNSSSMVSIMPSVLKQLIHLIMFAKTVNVPFELYSFTCDGSYANDISHLTEGDMGVSSNILQLTSSTLSKADFEESMFHLYAKSVLSGDYYAEIIAIPPIERMSGTPLVESVIALRPEMKKFAKKVQKPIFVNLLDGDARMPGHRGYEGTNSDVRRGCFIADENGDKIKIDFVKGSRFDKNTIRRSLINNAVKSLGYTTTCIFLANSAKDISYYIIDSLTGKPGFYAGGKKFIVESNKKDGCAIFGESFGYDVTYVILNDSLNDHIDAEYKSSKVKDIRKTFIQNRKNSKKDKIFLRHFGDFVA